MGSRAPGGALLQIDKKPEGTPYGGFRVVAVGWVPSGAIGAA